MPLRGKGAPNTGLGLLKILELLGPRLISNEGRDDDEGGGNLGGDEHVWKVVNTCGTLRAWPQVPILAPERPARGEKSTEVGSFPLRRSSQKSSFVHAR